MKLFFVGGASQARLCYNIVRQHGHEVPFIYDRTKGLAPPWDCVLFDDESAIPEHARQCEGFLVCIGDAYGKARVRFSEQLRALGLAPVSAVHPTAYISDAARIGAGLQAMPRCLVDDFATVGEFCILNAQCTVGHECMLGRGTHVMIAAALCGLVRVGDYSTIGTNATVLPRVSIGTNCYVGAGAVVTEDVPDNAVVAGVPARVIRYRGAEEGDGTPPPGAGD